MCDEEKNLSSSPTKLQYNSDPTEIENLKIDVDEIQQNKKFINLYCCKLSIGIIFTYIFIICSITINIVNRIIFLQYKFKFNITFIFLQQFFCLIFFYSASKNSEIFYKEAGEISFNDFYKLRYQYIFYCIFFITKTITSFLGYQLVTNIPMYVNLRKFLTAMTFFYQCCFKKKRISNINILVVFLLTLGAFLAGIDDYSTDYKGYLAVFMKNSLNLVNLEISENFKKKNGITNLKLLVFNYLGLCFYLLVSCSVVLITNSSFYISNEKNTSLFTQLLSDTKYIFITLISYSVLKTFTFTWKNILGLLISTLAAIIISISTLYDNIQFKNKTDDKVDNEMQEVKIETENSNKDLVKI